MDFQVHQYKTRSYERLLKHNEFSHSSEEGFELVCGIDNCTKNVSFCPLFEEIYSEVQWKFQQSKQDKLLLMLDTLANVQEESDEEGNDVNRVDRVPFDYTSRVARFMLTLREKYNTPESAVEYSVDELSNILQTSPKIVRARAVF